MGLFGAFKGASGALCLGRLWFCGSASRLRGARLCTLNSCRKPLARFFPGSGWFGIAAPWSVPFRGQGATLPGLVKCSALVFHRLGGCFFRLLGAGGGGFGTLGFGVWVSRAQELKLWGLGV